MKINRPKILDFLKNQTKKMLLIRTIYYPIEIKDSSVSVFYIIPKILRNPNISLQFDD